MKKPLLILVDDDAAVLEALEAELAPAFGAIARIETFDDPRAMLENLPRWTEERRPIAVAIVDQKMPGMTGVEVLVSLREAAGAAALGGAFHPGRHMRAILLTGYAGLDSALAAKNQARVDRYVEKPWRSGPLAAMVRELTRLHLGASGAGAHYVFREVRSEEEVRQVLRLRFEVYARAGAVAHLLPEKDVEHLDVDGYDAFSRLFGLFALGLGGGAVVGTLRVTGDEAAPAFERIREVVAPFPALLERLGQPRSHPLPMMNYLVDRDAVAVLVERIRASGEKVVEPGRLTLLPEYRSMAAGSAKQLARHIIDGAVAFFFFFRIEHAILTCAPPQDLFYRPYGFRPTEGTSTKYMPALEASFACLHGSISWVPSPARERCESLAARIARTGGACRCATFPDCLGGPYESGLFHDSDLFCPVAATELLDGSGAEGETGVS